ncbi:multidrug resistance outer membrane protein [Escherichia coli]|uniref:Multidrug resistance outer membrane protein n=1 Tax=Escherichia coli TaxID=562 RepID=A0A377KE66_ECOLX|nr:multidrug resistance outer membrane protein [Escherichia coli]
MRQHWVWTGRTIRKPQSVWFAGLDLDLWGVHRSAVAAAIGAHNAALAETAAVELSLTTGVAQLYYSMQASYQMLDLLEQTRDCD